MEHPERPLSATTLPSEVPTLGVRGSWDGLGVIITVGSEVAGNLYWIRNWGGDGGGTYDGLDVDAEMSAAKAEMYVGGALPPLGVII